MPQYTARVTGEIWWPMGPKFATSYTYSAEDDDHAVDKVDTESGDFSSIDDFEVVRYTTAYCGHADTEVVRPFETEDGELQYMDCMSEGE